MDFSSTLTYLKKNYILAGSALVALLCLGVHYIRSEQITRLAANYDDLQVRHTRILKNLKHASEIDADLEELKKLSIEVESRLFTPEDLATNQRYFYQIESNSGVEMLSIQQIIKPLPAGRANKKARKKAQMSKYQELIYDMNVDGSYEDVLIFMRNVEGGTAFAALDGFSVVSKSLSTGEPKVSMRVSFSVLGKKS